MRENQPIQEAERHEEAEAPDRANLNGMALTKRIEMALSRDYPEVSAQKLISEKNIKALEELKRRYEQKQPCQELAELFKITCALCTEIDDCLKCSWIILTGESCTGHYYKHVVSDELKRLARIRQIGRWIMAWKIYLRKLKASK